MTSLRTITIVSFLLGSVSLYAAPELKFGIIIPKGTVFAKPYYKMRSRLKGKINVKIFPGGRAGNESRMLARLKKGSLDMAMLTAVPLGRIVSKVRLFEIPYFFKNAAHKGRTIKKLYPLLKKDFKKKGLILAGWGNLGDIYMFTQTPVTKLNDFKKVRMWAPKGEPMAKAMYQEWGFVAHYSTIEGLLGNLEKKRITAFLGPSSAVIGMGWFRHAKFATFPKITSYSGALVISAKSFEKLSKEEQKLIVKEGERAVKIMSKNIVVSDKKSWKVLKRRGYKFVQISKEMDANLRKNSKKVEKKLMKQGYYSKKWYKKVRKLRDKTR